MTAGVEAVEEVEGGGSGPLVRSKWGAELLTFV